MLHSEKNETPLRSVALGTKEMDVERRNSNIYLSLREQLEPYPERATQRLLHWAKVAPDRCFLAQQLSDSSWQKITFSETLAQVRSIGQWLLDQGLSPKKPLLLLSENEINHALLGLAAMHVGIPFIPVSPAYSQLEDLNRLKYLIDLVKPGAAYANDSKRYARAFNVLGKSVVRITEADMISLQQTTATHAVDEAYHSITEDTLAKVMFTSGSTGQPKGVLFPHKMLSSNYQQVAQAMAFLQTKPPILIDWLPWHHTFGGTHNLGIALYNGGTFYIDPGKPTAEGIEPTIALLRTVRPTVYFNTPLGYQAILPYLRKDAALRENFFSDLQLLFYGAARFPEHLWAELDELAINTLGERILITSGIGSTEAGPSPNFTPWDPGRKPTVGAPVAGVTIKIAPVDDKLEMRFKGPCITPGYWQDPAKTASAFDDEGYFCSGDAVVFVNSDRPEMGLRFDGRIADNFKLSSGTWVDVTALRGELIAAGAPYLRDAVITGHDRDYLGALFFPNIETVHELDPSLSSDANINTVMNSPSVKAFFQTLINKLGKNERASSRRLCRASLEIEPPTLSNGELSDKNAISQRAVLANRAQVLIDIYTEPKADWILQSEDSHNANSVIENHNAMAGNPAR